MIENSNLTSGWSTDNGRKTYTIRCIRCGVRAAMVANPVEGPDRTKEEVEFEVFEGFRALSAFMGCEACKDV